MQSWRLVTEADLTRWFGARMVAKARAIVNAGGVRSLVRTSAGEACATVDGLRVGRGFFTGVVMDVEGKRRIFPSRCSCDGSRCSHATAVAVALRKFVRAGKTPPLMGRNDPRIARLPRPESDFESWEEPPEDYSWLPLPRSEPTKRKQEPVEGQGQPGDDIPY